MIFISHSSKDHSIALLIRNILELHGIETWIAPEDILPGTEDHTLAEIENIQACSIFLLLLSKNTETSDYVYDEIERAKKIHRKIWVLKIDNTAENDIADELRYKIGRSQRFDINNLNLKGFIDEISMGERYFETDIDSHGHKFSLIKGNFDSNMKFLIDNGKVDAGTTYFAMGMDVSGKISKLTKSGIFWSVCQYLKDEFGVMPESLQAKMDTAIGELHKDGTPLCLGDIITVSIPIMPKVFRQFSVNLLLIANSGMVSNDDKSESIAGIDSREAVIKIFNKCAEIKDMATLVIGAIGTNVMLFPYEVVTAEIMNSYLFSIKKGCTPQNLCYSVRKEDMLKHNLEDAEIYRYIRSVISFFYHRNNH